MKKQYGFNFFELMIALAIGGVLLSIAIPSMSTYLANTNLTSAANQMVSLINYARSEAIKRNSQVVICRTTEASVDADSPDNSTCAPDGEANTWNDEYLVYATPGRTTADVAYDPVAGDIILRTGSSNTRINTIASGSANVFLTFNADGTRHSNENQFVFAFCDDRDEDFGRAVVVANNGRPEVRKTTTAPVGGNDYDCNPAG